MSVYQIKRLTKETSPFFFSRGSLRFFGQTLKDFRVYKQKNGKYLLTAPMFCGPGGHRCGTTERLFNPATNELERITK